MFKENLTPHSLSQFIKLTSHQKNLLFIMITEARGMPLNYVKDLFELILAANFPDDKNLQIILKNLALEVLQGIDVNEAWA